MPTDLDLVIEGGTVIDGTKAPRFDADIGIVGTRIVAVTRPGGLARHAAKRRLAAHGRIVAPGFIDAHTHDDLALLRRPAMEFKVSQGVTTVVTGNCGISPAPLEADTPTPQPISLAVHDGEDDGDGRNGAVGRGRFRAFGAYLDAMRAAPAAVNVAPLLGHTTLRARCVADLGRAANEAEVRAMQAHVREALEAGAIGVSTGTYYPPAAAASTEEIIEVCRPLSGDGGDGGSGPRGVYATHMRDEQDAVLASIDETLRIGRELGVPVVISHHKVTGQANWGRSTETLAKIGAAMRHQCVALDCYPYTAGSTMLHNDPVRLQGRVLIAHSEPHPGTAGRELADIAAEWGCDKMEAVRRLQPASAIYFMMSEADVQRVLAFEPTMIGSDGIPLGPRPHPRLWGTFPRVLGHYSRQLNLFPLETAVWKMTGLTAGNFGLEGRGRIAEGAFADLVVFDADAVLDTATYEEPQRASAGIDAVVVNGQAVWGAGGDTGARPGQVLRRGGSRMQRG
ncbi:MAG: D-aminoacylase [Rubrivivax sp.]|nr:D-aminoacylase [Rubrivivax sp.]